MIEIALVGLAVVALFVVLHLQPLSKEEVDALAGKRRSIEISRFFTWSNVEIIADPRFKSAMNTNGALHSINEPISTFPATAAGLLKSKKHEWVVFGFAKGSAVELLYFNKGADNASVSPNLSTAQLLEVVHRIEANTVLMLHNHPNGVLHPSAQDLTSARHFTDLLNPVGVSFVDFVCGRGRFVQYHRSVSDQAFPVGGFKSDILRVNGKSRMGNLRLHLERLFW